MSDNQSPGPSQPKYRFGWLHLILILSLCANLAVVGAIVSHRYFDRDHHHRRISGPGFTQILPRRFFGDLPSNRRSELVEKLRSHRDDFRELRRKLRESAAHVADVLEAEPYDAEAAERAIGAYAEQGGEMVERGAKIAREFLQELSPEERKLLAKRIRERAERRRKYKD